MRMLLVVATKADFLENDSKITRLFGCNQMGNQTDPIEVRYLNSMLIKGGGEDNSHYIELVAPKNITV